MRVVECNADAALVKCLVSVPKRDVIHAPGKGGVRKQLEENWADSKGLVDEDPGAGRLRLGRQWVRVSRRSIASSDIKYFYDASRNNHLIVLCPRLEDWILKTAEIAKIDVTRHGFLSNNPNDFRKIVYLRVDKFRLLVRILLKKKSTRLLTLQSLL